MRVRVIGGGIVGLSTAYELAQRGVSVTVYEPSAASARASFGNAGMIVPSHFEPMASFGMVRLGLRMMRDPAAPFGFDRPWQRESIRWITRFFRACRAGDRSARERELLDLNLASRAVYAEWATAGGFRWRTDGLLMVCRTATGLAGEARVAHHAHLLGLSAEVLDSAQTREKLGVKADSVGSVWFPQDAQVDAAEVLTWLTNACAQGGVRILPIAAPQSDDGFHETVLAAGFATAELAQKRGRFVPMLAGKGYGVTLTGVAARPDRCGILTEDRVAFAPLDHGLRITGTMEMSLGDLGVNHRRWGRVGQSIRAALADLAHISWPAPDWVGLRPCSPDGFPYVGTLGPRLWIGAGHGMMGMSLGPITGRLLAQRILGEEPTLRLEYCDPHRYDPS